MTYEQLKSEVLKLIEEYVDTQDELTDDEDIANKIVPATNKILFELSRFKKIEAMETIEVTEGQDFELSSLDNFFQLKLIRGVEYDKIGKYVTFLEDGTAKIYYYRYPTMIDEDTDDDFELELDMDALNIAPVGIAGTILLTDISNQYGRAFLNRYETMINRLDSRNDAGSITFETGVEL